MIKEPLVIMRRGEVAGIFFPTPLESIPFEFKKDIFITLTDSIKKKLQAQGVKVDTKGSPKAGGPSLRRRNL